MHRTPDAAPAVTETGWEVASPAAQARVGVLVVQFGVFVPTLTVAAPVLPLVRVTMNVAVPLTSREPGAITFSTPVGDPPLQFTVTVPLMSTEMVEYVAEPVPGHPTKLTVSADAGVLTKAMPAVAATRAHAREMKPRSRVIENSLVGCPARARR
ncbi:hypothetical protein BWI17_08060 [Betaproteobacteria bacterium GR16-43]|nr:hypothetical protein BWI17_08060 [Betaproteobacteria bacterium GR16-43]